MKNDAIVRDILAEINEMSLEELKNALLGNVNGPIYQAVSFDPYEALYDCFYDAHSNYKLSKVLSKNEFLAMIAKLDFNAKIAGRISMAAANDECYNYSLAA